MRFKDYKNEQVASAFVEVFDQIYTYPLFRWRAFVRSVLFTTVVSLVFIFELRNYFYSVFSGLHLLMVYEVLVALMFNVFTDYLSLFVIRSLLVRSGMKPVIGLALGAASGMAIVWIANILRGQAIIAERCVFVAPWFCDEFIFDLSLGSTFYVWPALAVFAWLPLFALGIVIARLLTPLSWIVGKAQWSLKEGKEHPLKAIGYVAAIVVFIGTIAGRAVFTG